MKFPRLKKKILTKQNIFHVLRSLKVDQSSSFGDSFAHLLAVSPFLSGPTYLSHVRSCSKVVLEKKLRMLWKPYWFNVALNSQSSFPKVVHIITSLIPQFGVVSSALQETFKNITLYLFTHLLTEFISLRYCLQCTIVSLKQTVTILKSLKNKLKRRKEFNILTGT